MKVVVKGKEQSIDKKPQKKSQTVSAKSTSLFPQMPKMNHVVQKRREGFLQFAVEYVINDIKSLFHKDKKSQEEKMKYEAFMELCKK